jgi:hypothetical protein
MRTPPQQACEVAQHARDAWVIAKTMHIFEQQQRGTVAIQVLQPLQNQHRLASPESFAAKHA